MSNIPVMNGSMNPEKHCEVRTDCLLTFASKEYPKNMIYQQDYVSCHRSKYTMDIASDNYIDVLFWPDNAIFIGVSRYLHGRSR